MHTATPTPCVTAQASLSASQPAMPCPARPSLGAPHTRIRNSPIPKPATPQQARKKKKGERERRGFPVSKYIYLDRIQGSELGIQLRLSSQHLQSNAKKYGKMIINKERRGERQGKRLSSRESAGEAAAGWGRGGAGRGLRRHREFRRPRLGSEGRRARGGGQAGGAGSAARYPRARRRCCSRSRAPRSAARRWPRSRRRRRLPPGSWRRRWPIGSSPVIRALSPSCRAW